MNAQPDVSRLRDMGGILPANDRLIRESLPFSRLANGIPRGALTEISGPAGGGKSEVVLKFLAENPSLRVAWIEDEMSVFPGAFPLRGVKLERVLFGETATELVWTAQQMLRSGLFEIVVIGTSLQAIGETDLRRLQLTAEQSRSTVILIREEPSRQSTWPLTLQLQVTRLFSVPQLRVLKGAGAWA